ncbi:MAG: ATPase, partial [Mesorhizobium sp.]
VCLGLCALSESRQPAPGNAADPLDSIVTFTLGRTASGGTHLRIVHDGFARVATSAVAMVGAGCRLSLNAHSPKQTIAANTPRLFLRAA